MVCIVCFWKDVLRGMGMQDKLVLGELKLGKVIQGNNARWRGNRNIFTCMSMMVVKFVNHPKRLSYSIAKSQYVSFGLTVLPNRPQSVGL